VNPIRPMRPFARLFIVLTAAALAAATFCSDSLIASRDDQHVPSLPPAEWESNAMGLPTPNQNH
jgi:hypothetical protein